MVECPYCGDYSGDKSEVAQHAWTSGDPDHKGINYQKAEKQIELNSDGGTSGDDTPDSEDDTADTAGSGTSGGNSGDPAMDTPEADDSGSSDDAIACPECGGDLVGGVREEYEVDVDYICSKCGQGFTDD